MSIQILHTGINECTIELQPLIGDADGAVLHMLPGGTDNKEGFGKILDLYASTAKGLGVSRGGHYHPILDEFFFTMTGTALWILSDFRTDSPTYKKTVALIASFDKPTETFDLPTYTTLDGALPRLRVPHGVYHTFYPLTDERVTIVAVGSTAYDKTDYVYPTADEVPEMQKILLRCGIDAQKRIHQ